MSKRMLALCAFVAVPFVGAGCSSVDDLDSEGTASAVIAITTVPTGVQCVNITATGSRVATSSFSVTTGIAATLSMTGLPTGSVTFSGNAFAAACPSVLATDVPTYVGVPTVAQLSTTAVTQVTLPMAKNGRASVTLDFEGDGTMCAASGQTCGASTPCCSGLSCTGNAQGTTTCTATPLCAASGQTCSAATQCCAGLSCNASPTGAASTCGTTATMCAASGQTCGANTPCCSGLSCTGNAQGTTTCTATPMCAASGQTCSAATQCCAGLSCNASPTGMASTCGTTATMCRTSGQTCSATQACCTPLACSAVPPSTTVTCH